MRVFNRRLLSCGLLVFVMALGGVFGMGNVAQQRAHAHGQDHLAIVSDEKFPIGLWWPPPPGATTIDRYQEMADAGFTFVIGGNGVVNKALSRRLLEVAGHVGIDVIVTDQRVTARTFSKRYLDQERGYLQEVIDDYIEYPAFAGLNLFDEPGTDRYASLSVATQLLESIAPGKLAYVNLFPSYVSTGAIKARDYEEYISRFITEVRPPVLSYDHYPLLVADDASGEPTPITEDYFYNWAVIRKAALEADIPPWIFIQSVDYQDHRLPTEAEMLWQINASLAYGAKGIMYFTYWTPQSHENFNTALITPDGERTPLYGYAQTINRYLSAVGKALKPLVSVSVSHVEEQLPRGTVAFEPDEWIQSVVGSEVIVSQFVDPAARTDRLDDQDDGENRWVLIVNRSFSDAATVTVTLQSAVETVSYFDPSASSYQPESFGRQAASEISSGASAATLSPTLDVDLGPGEAKLYLLSK